MMTVSIQHLMTECSRLSASVFCNGQRSDSDAVQQYSDGWGKVEHYWGWNMSSYTPSEHVSLKHNVNSSVEDCRQWRSTWSHFIKLPNRRLSAVHPNSIESVIVISQLWLTWHLSLKSPCGCIWNVLHEAHIHNFTKIVHASAGDICKAIINIQVKRICHFKFF